MGKKFGFSFSWKRALGISGAKSKISRGIGIPLTRQGRQRKVGRLMGCLTYVILLTIFIIVFVISIILLLF